MEATTSHKTHTVTDTTGRTIGWATEQSRGLSVVTDNGIDLLTPAANLTEARAMLLEHRHQTMH